MATRKSTPADKAALRAQAEARLGEKSLRFEAAEHASAEELQRLVHEMQVHQVELELQNEELQLAHAEEEIGRARYANLYDFAPIGYLTLSPDGTIHQANLTGAGMLGLERARLVGTRLGVFVSPESLPNFATFLRNVFQYQSNEICEVALRPQSGAPRWVHIEATANQDVGHECRAVLVDITERKRGEEALQLSQERYKNLFQSMDEAFALCEMINDQAGRPVDFRFLELNSAFARHTGLGVEQVLGRTVKEVLPDIETCWIGLCDRVLRTGLPERMEGRVQGLGRQLSMHAWRADSTRVALAFTDVTALRQTEEQLRVAQRMEAIGRLAGGIAHDFNNLLTVIINYTGFALEDMAGETPSRAHLVEVNKAAERAATLTRQLLAFSRKQVMQPQVLDLNLVIGGMEGMLRSLLGEDIVVSVVPAMGLAKVMADPGQVEQVVMNLAVNARDAMTNGGTLTIETANTEIDAASASLLPGVRPGPHVRLTVTDTGCGMDEKTRAQLFEPFFTTKRTGKGTGLGLATVYGIVRQSDGAIGVHSEPGKGTTFTVLLPRELSVTPTPVRTATVPTHAAGAETILIVEDEAAVRNLTARILSLAGYTVLTAASGAQALQICEQQQGSVHLVLTDVVMPEMGGKELATHLSQLYPHLRLLFMSGYTKEAIQDRGVLEQGTHFIGKPFSPAELRTIVRQVLDGETPAGQSNRKAGCS